MTKKLESYLSLLDLSYIEAVKLLLVKYGPSVNNYFRQKSYEKFLNGEIANITKGKISRSNEGLYCHHIDENKYLNLGNKEYIKIQEVPFNTQEKDRLVYCDLIEHTILHILIAKETDSELGYPGLSKFLLPNIFEWYVKGNVPVIEWQKRCYDKAFLSIEENDKLTSKFKDVLAENYYSKLKETDHGTI